MPSCGRGGGQSAPNGGGPASPGSHPHPTGPVGRRNLVGTQRQKLLPGLSGAAPPPFPGQACISRNECVVHGHPSNDELPFAQGDLVKVDVGALKNGFIGDAAWTYHLGPPNPSDRALMDAGIASLRTGIAAIKPGGELLDWAVAVQDLVEGQLGLHLVRGFGGHGVGRQLHEAPFIANVRPSYPGEWTECRVRKPGMLVASP